MNESLFGSGNLLLLSLLLIILLLAAHLVFSFLHGRVIENSPLIAIDRDLRFKVAALETQRDELKDQILELEKEVSKRAAFVAEVSVLEERLAVLRLEYDNLAAARQEIEQVRQEAANVAAEYAQMGQKLENGREELASIEKTKMAFEIERIDLERRKAELAEKIGDLKEESGEIENELGTLRSERDFLLGLRNEVNALQTSKSMLEKELEHLEGKIENLDDERIEHGKLETELNVLELQLQQKRQESQNVASRVNALERELATLEAKHAELAEIEHKHADLAAEFTVVRTRLAEGQEEVQRTVTQAESLKKELADTEARLARLAEDKERFKTLRQQLTETESAVEKAAREKDRLERTIDSRRIELGELDGTGPVDQNDLAKDLEMVPAILNAPANIGRAFKEEKEALHGVATYLEKRGLTFSDRTLRSFHTALKTNDYAQMTILAGVSGTGKSQLPRRYAEAMGIHFLQIAVEPRWDSPQDLLGFYNYIEKKYRATDFARALVHMDPYNTSQLAKPAYKDHMLLILLDEMNLARVEYYFSEFLSRLEARPHYSEVADALKRRDAQIPIDIRSSKSSMSVFPGHNVLFAGTMNDDESTQALSDKVLDRSNVMQFSAPVKFDQKPGDASLKPAETGLPFEQWRSWIKPIGSLGDADRRKTEKSLERLAQIMKECGRPFGFRLHEAVKAYVANYPRKSNLADEVDAALADQIEFRIMPKLRGVDLDAFGSALNDLADFIRNNLRDSLFADEIEAAVSRGQGTTGLFAWRGLQRG